MTIEQQHPLLGDSDGEHVYTPSPRPRRMPRLHLSRRAVILIVAAVVSLAALYHLPYHLPRAFDETVVEPQHPDIERAVRVRVLQELIDTYYPMEPHHSQAVKDYNKNVLGRLEHCLIEGTCTETERKVVVFSSAHFMAWMDAHTSGEDVWAHSTILALQSLNYSTIITLGHMNTLLVYQHLPEMIPAIIIEGATLQVCIERNETNYAALETKENRPGIWQTGKKACVQRPDFPEGIPLWKMFAFHFWGGTMTPLGHRWTLSPEDYAAHEGKPASEGNYYLGYSIEDHCKAQPFFSLREHRAMILAKDPRYFEEEFNGFRGLIAGAIEAVPHVERNGEDVPFEALALAGYLHDGKPPPVPEPGVTNIGRLPAAEWQETLARSKVLLGIGSPKLSPSPYEALCAGVPFINPILGWAEDDPTDRSKWYTQTNGLRDIEEPYVYHVAKGDQVGLTEALTKAAANPIDRYIPPRMRPENVAERHRVLVENNWYEEARQVVLKNAAKEPEKDWAWMAMEEYNPYV